VAPVGLEADRVVLDEEARERREVEVAVVVHLPEPRERGGLLPRGERVARVVEARVEEELAVGHRGSPWLG
jgi:hypothetical protein